MILTDTMKGLLINADAVTEMLALHAKSAKNLAAAYDTLKAAGCPESHMPAKEDTIVKPVLYTAKSWIDAAQNTSHAMPVPRGCGSRKPGIYFEAGVSGPGAISFWDCVFDPPQAIPAGLTIPAQGVLGMPRTTFNPDIGKPETTYHILDRIGLQYYPNVLDFIAESLQFGVSRRVPASFDLSHLTPQSRLLLIHDRALVQGALGMERPCVLKFAGKPIPAEHGSSYHCAGYWWETVTGGRKVLIAHTSGHLPGDLSLNSVRPKKLLWPSRSTNDGQYQDWVRIVYREMPWGNYTARCADVSTHLTYEPAIFMSVPITGIVVVKDKADAAKTTWYAKKAAKADIPVYLSDL